MTNISLVQSLSLVSEVESKGVHKKMEELTTISVISVY